jgi:hypothetical protein
MATPVTPGEGGRSPFRRERELVCLTKAPAVTAPARPAPAARGAVSLEPLTALLRDYNARMTPTFEESRRAPVAAVARAARRASVPSVVADLPNYYCVEVAEDRKDELAARLRQHPLIEAAFVKPAPEPPVRPPEAGGPASPPLPVVPHRPPRPRT